MNPHSYRLKGRDFVHQGKIEIDVNERAVLSNRKTAFSFTPTPIVSLTIWRIEKIEVLMVDNMEWFNVFGLIFIAVIMIPNVVFAIKCKDGFDNKWNNKYVEVTEQVGRLGCFGFMIINIPGTWFGWWSDEALALYLIVDTILVMLYCAIWIICFKKNSVFRALALSIIPSMLFLFSGIMSRSVLLIIASVLFAPSHIVISYKNVK